jgi:hypothetical protein
LLGHLRGGGDGVRVDHERKNECGGIGQGLARGGLKESLPDSASLARGEVRRPKRGMLDHGLGFEVAADPDLDIAAEQSPDLGIDLILRRTFRWSVPRKCELARRIGRRRAGATGQPVASDASERGEEQP